MYGCNGTGGGGGGIGYAFGMFIALYAAVVKLTAGMGGSLTDIGKFGYDGKK